MFSRKFVPDNYTVPTQVDTPDFVLRPMHPKYTAVDMASVQRVKLGEISQNDTVDENHRPNANGWITGLAGAEAMFVSREVFTYVVLTPEEDYELGCVYITPSWKVGFDADVVIWVRDDVNNPKLDSALFEFSQAWVERDWPFATVAYPGRTQSWEQWATLEDKQSPHWQTEPRKEALIPPPLIPEDFEVPEQIQGDGFNLHMFDMDLYGVDYEACLASVEAIKQQLPGLEQEAPWLTRDCDIHQHACRLGYEMKRQLYRNSFSYGILEPGQPLSSLGSLHIQPSRKRGYEAEVYFWVRASELDGDLAQRVYEFTRAWLQETWPFDADKVLCPGRDISWDEWHNLEDIEPDNTRLPRG